MTSEDYSPYCPVCSGCGEEGCCSPLMCEQSPDGSYCGIYLNELKMGYELSIWVENVLFATMTEEQKKRFDDKWDELYDKHHKQIEKKDE